jgi:putative transposase
MRHHLVVMLREGAGREASPTAAIIDTQSAKTTESGGPRGWDAAKRLKGRKRHVAVDTDGLLLGVLVHAADIQDADGLGGLLKRVRLLLGSGVMTRGWVASLMGVCDGGRGIG